MLPIALSAVLVLVVLDKRPDCIDEVGKRLEREAVRLPELLLVVALEDSVPRDVHVATNQIVHDDKV